MHVESVDTPSLLELRAMVAQRLQAYSALEECTAADRRTILAQACLVIWHLTAGEEGRTWYLTRLAPPVDGTRSQTVLDTMARLCRDTSPRGTRASGRTAGILANGRAAVTASMR